MVSCFKNLHRKPLLMLGALWPLVLLAPNIPGIPRAALASLPWRQELALTLLLTLTIVLLLRKVPSERTASIDRSPVVVPIFGAAFVSWIWLSITWSTDHYSALHLAVQWSSYLVFFALIVSAPTKAIRSSFIILAIVIWMLAISCAIESWFGGPVTDASLRIGVKPLLRASGNFGEIMGGASILFTAFALSLNRRRFVWMCGATAVAGWLGTIQSLERAPFVGACTGLLLLSVGVLIRPSRRRFWRLGLLGSAFALVLILHVTPSPASEQDVPTVNRLQQSLVSDVNTQARFLLWGVGLEILRAHPLLGVGANNYQVHFAEGRAQFAARYPASPLVAMNEQLLPIYAHNEYVQMLAELGIIGLLLFVLFGLGLVATLIAALRARGQQLPVLGAGCAMLAFAISSGASASSFRYMSGGLIFFFSAALIARRVNRTHKFADESVSVKVRSTASRLIGLCLCGVMPLSVPLFMAQAAGTVLQQLAETSPGAQQAEAYYRASLRVYPANTAAKFGYGMWLYGNGRAAESVPYLRDAVNMGLNTSICYEYLAAAEDWAGDAIAAEQTLNSGVQAYPVSVFLLVRHSVALERLGRISDAERELSKGEMIDPRASRGWHQLIVNDIDAAYAAAARNPDIAKPGELSPDAAVFAVLKENERRFPGAANSGWRMRIRSVKFSR